MRTVDDLRRALVDGAADLDSPLTLPGIRARAARRRLTQAVTAVAAAVGIAVGVAAVALPGGGPPPAAAPDGGVLRSPLPEMSIPPVGEVITTGARIATGEELVLWFSGNGLQGALRDPGTGTLRELEVPLRNVGGAPGFAELWQVDTRSGEVIEYGAFTGDAAEVTASVGGTVHRAGLAVWSANPDVVAFWTVRPATPLPTRSPGSGLPHEPGAQQPLFTARDASGTVLATSEGLVMERADIGVVAADQPRVGAVIRTGVTLDGGDELVLWFTGDSGSALLRWAGRDPASGEIGPATIVGGYARPPFPVGFYRGWQTVPGAGDTRIRLGTYVGPAQRVEASGTGGARGSAAWSAHPELRLFWLVGPGYGGTGAVAYGRDGEVVERWDGRTGWPTRAPTGPPR
jgi:hypothetical protein